MPASLTATPPEAPPPAAAQPPASSPSRHLLTLIVDALQVPAPAPADEAACLALVGRRSRAVLDACRRVPAAPGDGGTLNAARDLYDAVSGLPATYHARPAGPGAPGGKHRPVSGAPHSPARPPDPVDAARDVLARRAEAGFPGWAVRHGLHGWTGSRSQDTRTERSDSLPGLTALMTVADDAARARTPRHPERLPVTAPALPPPAASSPSRHLLTLIVDALQVPAPAPAGEAACLALLSRRSRAVLDACRRALAAPGDGGTLHAARDLYDAVSGLPATYQPAPATRPASPGAPGGEHQ